MAERKSKQAEGPIRKHDINMFHDWSGDSGKKNQIWALGNERLTLVTRRRRDHRDVQDRYGGLEDSFYSMGIDCKMTFLQR